MQSPVTFVMILGHIFPKCRLLLLLVTHGPTVGARFASSVSLSRHRSMLVGQCLGRESSEKPLVTRKSLSQS